MIAISAALERRLVSIRRDATGGWDERTRGKAPHKPFLLLAVLDGIEAGVVRENLVAYDEDLLAAFDLYWGEWFPDRVTNPAQPFWYLKGDGLWTLVARPGQEARLRAMQDGGKVPSLVVLHEVVAGARLDDELFGLVLTPIGRACVRERLIGAHLSAERQSALAARHAVVIEAHRYASELRRRAERELGELFVTSDPLDAAFTELRPTPSEGPPPGGPAVEVRTIPLRGRPGGRPSESEARARLSRRRTSSRSRCATATTRGTGSRCVGRTTGRSTTGC